ncbi:MAG: BlaI/MecI/CopY family transcriptional regulator [Bacteroidota bacterium]
MEQLTKAEEKIMQILWELEEGFVKDIIAQMPPPPPPYTSVSTIVRILEEKGFVDHKSYGRSYQYFPKVSKEDYRKFSFRKLMSNYFEGSLESVVSYMVKEEELGKAELEELLKMIDEDEAGGKAS